MERFHGACWDSWSKPNGRTISEEKMDIMFPRSGSIRSVCFGNDIISIETANVSCEFMIGAYLR